MDDSRSQSCLTYLRHPALPGVELLVANPSMGSWRMFHERHLICGCPSVATSWVYRRKDHHIEDGMTAFMEPGEIHRVIAKRKPSQFIALFLESDRFVEFARESGATGAPHFRFTEVRSPCLLEKLVQLSSSLESANDALDLQSQFVMLMEEALNYTECRPPPFRASGPALRRSLERARDLLEERNNEPVTLEELAAASALSRFHLVRSFSAQFGLPPHAYQIHVRIEHACRLLRAGVPCAAVAFSAGFADQSHFARHFKGIMGVAPSVYARSPLAPPGGVSAPVRSLCSSR